MDTLSSREIVELWERASEASPVERPVRMLATALSVSADSIAGLPLGRRDALLLELREATFGRRMHGFALCPDCGERLELELDARTLRQSDEPAEDAWSDDGVAFRVRPLSTVDLLAISSLEPGAATSALLERAVIAAERDGGAVALDALDAELRGRLVDRLAACDPLAEILLSLACPTCGAAWSLPFDVASFVWSEFSTAARRLLGDVHTLASAYGWTESEILALGAARREFYLEMIT